MVFHAGGDSGDCGVDPLSLRHCHCVLGFVKAGHVIRSLDIHDEWNGCLLVSRVALVCHLDLTLKHNSHNVTLARYMSQRQGTCHKAGVHATKAENMSHRPGTCHTGQVHVTPARYMSHRPGTCHTGQVHVTPAMYMSHRPGTCHTGQAHVTPARYMSRHTCIHHMGRV